MLRNTIFLGIASLSLLLNSVAAYAACSRVIQVPVATVGFSVITTKQPVSGVYPDLLRGVKDCQFNFSVVPRARLEAMFEAGKADLLVPATKTPKRDEFGVFVPIVANRATLIYNGNTQIQANSLAQLLENKKLRFAFVRGFDYGTAYQDFLQELEKQGRLILETDALAVGRLMQAGLVDASIMAPAIFVAAIDGDPRSQGLQAKLKFKPMPEFPWGESGVYISRQAVSIADQTTLREGLRSAVESGQVWKTFQKYYQSEVLEGSIAPKK